MTRPRTVSDETILEAARLVFTRDGPSAPTSAVALAVGVSEATIFKRFNSKEALLHAALRCPIDLWHDDTAERVGRSTIDEELQGLLRELIAFFRDAMPRMVMMMSSKGLDPLSFLRETPEPAPDQGPQAGPRFVIGRLSDWAEAEMGLGRLKPLPPEVVARTISAACHQYVFFELANFPPSVGESQFIAALASMLLSGMAGDAPAPKDEP